MPERLGFSDADRRELLCLQSADKPHCGRKGRGLELGELDLQVADKPANLAHAHPTMLCIHLVSTTTILVRCLEEAASLVVKLN